MPEQDNKTAPSETYLKVQDITLPCDRCAKFGGIPVTLPAAAELSGTSWTFADPESDFKISLTLRNGQISGELVRGQAPAEKCWEILKEADKVILPLRFPDLLLRINLACPNRPPERTGAPPAPEENGEDGKTWLCLDIGNTRTCALLDLPDPDIAFFRVENRKEERGIFNSLCAAWAPKAGDCGAAFVLMGKDAAELRRDVAAPRGETFSLSTPKRFFWDERPDSESLRCVNGGKLAKIDPGTMPFVEKLAGYSKQSQAPTRRLFMQGAIWKLLERAESTIRELRSLVDREQDFLDRVNELRIGPEKLSFDEDHDKVSELEKAMQGLSDNFVTDLVCTCPAAWLQDQRRAYRELIEDAVKAYCSPARICHKLEFHMECDEATAVLMSYLKRECDKAISDRTPLRNWLYRHGRIRKSERDNVTLVDCRIGVLDVGGGTSDLSIAELTYKYDTAKAKEGIIYRPECTNGTDQAGDYLLLQITLRILVPMVAAWLLNPSKCNDEGRLEDDGDKWNWDTYLAWFRDALVRGVGNKARRFARSFWFELAARAMAQADSDDSRLEFDPENSDDRGPEDPRNAQTMRQDFEDFRDFVKELSGISQGKVYAGSGFKAADTEEELTALQNKLDLDGAPGKKLQWRDWMGGGKTLSRLYRECIRKSLGYTAEMMSATLLVNDCDLVLFSGKTMENRLVQEFFGEYLPIPCQGLDKDSGKEDTAKGAEYYVRRDAPEMGLRIHIDDGKQERCADADEDFYWVVETVFGPKVWPRDKEIVFKTSEKETAVKRRKFRYFDQNDMPCYKLINNGQVSYGIEYKCTLQYDKEARPPRLELKSVTNPATGETCTGNWVLKIDMSNTGTNWLDTGIIKEEA